MTGVFLDAAVEGLDYTAGTSAKARTNAKGEFICKDTDSVSLLDEDGDPSNGIKLTPAVKALLNSRTDRHPGAAARCLQGPYG